MNAFDLLTDDEHCDLVAIQQAHLNDPAGEIAAKLLGAVQSLASVALAKDYHARQELSVVIPKHLTTTSQAHAGAPMVTTQGNAP